MELAKLYDSFGDKLYHYLVFRLGSREDAEDVLQEVFCRLARYERRLGSVRDMKTYVFRMARNEAHRFLKGRRNRLSDETLNPGGPAEAMASLIQRVDEGRKMLVSRSLTRLPDEQLEAVVLKIFDGLTFKEMAAVCGVSMNTAASRYRYGMARLREMLEGENDGS